MRDVATVVSHGRRHQRRAVDHRVYGYRSVGGLDAGGCEDKISYSAPLDEHITQLLARAEAGGPGDTAPAGMDTDC